ncbi:MAG: ATP-binding cassette domain-containing protein [Clostridia bacterium]|nr:ATP-binding cassette domain-containing protein [Clostridia bacterium]
MSLKVNIRKKLGSFEMHVCFEHEAGTLGILGASGCGKSMTLKCIAGIETPDEGRIELDGTVLFDSEKRINLPPQQRRVGYLFQSYALFPNMTVRQNILCGMHHEKDRHKRQEALEHVASLLQLEGLMNHRPHQLSGGQAQRAALARILVNKPRLLMLDEPFSALDSHLRTRLQIELKALLAQYGQPVLMVTHDRDEAYHMCARLAVMDQGSMQTPQETKALFANPGTLRAAALTGCKNIARAEKCGENEVYVPDWGIRLQTAQPVRDGLVGVAFRAHYLNPKTTLNSYPMHIVSEMEEPFEWILLLRYANQASDTEPVWWRVPKDRKPQQMPEQLGIAPANILLLYA